jgi:hypothetical protein
MLLSASLPPPSALPCQSDPAHLTFRSPVALHSYPPTPTHDSSAPRRRLDGGVSPSTVWSRRWPARRRVVSCGAVPAADRPTRHLPAELLGGVPVVRRRRGQVGQAVRRTVRCRSLSTIGVHPVRFLVRFGVQPSGVRPSGVRSPSPSSRTDPSGRLVSARPAVSCLVSARPSCGVCPVPGQPAVALGSTPVRQGP